jgi:hypothetical protein
MSPSMTWLAVGLGLLVLWQVIKWWPSEVTEREGEMAGVAPPPFESASSRAVTSQPHDLIAHLADERRPRPDSSSSSALRGLAAPAGPAVPYDWAAGEFGDAA